LKCIAPAFHSTKATLHTASWNFDEKQFFVCEKDIVENTSVLRLSKTHRNPAIKDFLQTVDVEI
jgi:hypothetical protein